MPRTRSTKPAARKSERKKPIEQYDHKGKERVTNPPVGLVTPNRESQIISLALSLLSGSYDISEADIDSAFIRRFDPMLSKWIDQIRGMMRTMIGLSGCEPLVDDDRGWVRHVVDNQGLKVEMSYKEGKLSGYSITVDNGYYRALDQELNQVKFPESPSLQWHERRLAEANQTRKIMDQIKWIEKRYALRPILNEHDPYDDEHIQQWFRQRELVEMLDWVITGRYVPPFRWDVTDIQDSRIGQGVSSTITPRRRLDSIEKLPRIKNRKVRVRTWLIYYLSQRGGGVLTELEAIDQWNKLWDRDVQLETRRLDRKGKRPLYDLQLPNYQKERDTLLSSGSSKKHMISALPDWWGHELVNDTIKRLSESPYK